MVEHRMINLSPGRVGTSSLNLIPDDKIEESFFCKACGGNIYKECKHYGCESERIRMCFLENKIRSWIKASKRGIDFSIIIEDMKKSMEIENDE